MSHWVGAPFCAFTVSIISHNKEYQACFQFDVSVNSPTKQMFWVQKSLQVCPSGNDHYESMSEPPNHHDLKVQCFYNLIRKKGV